MHFSDTEQVADCLVIVNSELYPSDQEIPILDGNEELNSSQSSEYGQTSDVKNLLLDIGDVSCDLNVHEVHQEDVSDPMEATIEGKIATKWELGRGLNREYHECY